MTTASSVKSKPKFSSRNLSAVYKAPAQLGGDGGGVSAGYRTGGVNGLNRLLVLRGPARTGAMGILDANAVAAPTPINTPSLRKEHMGQDIHVTLVPAGKSGGWGSSVSDSSVTTEESLVESERRLRPQMGGEKELRTPTREHKSVWDNGTAAMLVSRPQPPVNNLAPMLSSGSGRWGDDAVEEDLAQVDIEHTKQRQREFPDLHEQLTDPASSPQDQHYHHQQYQHIKSNQVCHDSILQPQDVRLQTETSYHHGHAPVYDDRASSRHEAGNNSGHNMRPEFHDQGSYTTNRPSSAYNNERGYRVSIQDARYGSPVRNPTHDQHGAYHEEIRQDFRRYSSHETRNFDGEAAGQSHGAYYAQLHRRDRSPTNDNQSEHVKTARSHESAWKDLPNTVATASALWKMSEAEANGTAACQMHSSNAYSLSSSSRAIARNTQVGSSDGSVSVSTVRILKRNGPRMLFDHKSGTMVEVVDSKSSQRSSTVIPAQPSVLMETKTYKTEQNMQVIETEKKELQPPSETFQTDCVEKAHEDYQAASPNDSVKAVVKEFSTVDDLKSAISGSSTPRQVKSSNSKTRVRESKTKLLPMGGKMKRVIVAYRPVVKTKIDVETTENKHTPTGRDRASAKRGRPNIPQPTHKNKKHQGNVSVSSDIELCGTTQPSQKSQPIKTRAKSTKATGSANGSVRTNTLNDSKPVRKNHRSDCGDINSESHTKTSSKFERLGSKTKRPSVKPASNVSLSVDDHQVEEDTLDDGGGAFTTVKSRRTILLERRKQREQLAAALSGFHERGGVKRPTNRVTVPASVARFGKKGLLVGLKQKPETQVAVGIVPAPILEKSFIDIIRPPGVAQEAEKIPQITVIDAGEKRIAHKPALHQSRTSRTPRTDSSTVRSRRVSLDLKAEFAEPAKEKNSSIRHNGQVSTSEALAREKKSTIHRSKGKENDADYSETQKAHSQSTKTESRPRRASTVKKEIKMYVPKVVPVQRTATASKVHVDASPVIASDPVKSALEHTRAVVVPASPKSTSEETSSIAKKSASLSNRLCVPSETSPSVMTASANSSPPPSNLSHDATRTSAPTERKLSKKSKSDISMNRPVRATRQRKKSNFVKSEIPEPESTKPDAAQHTQLIPAPTAIAAQPLAKMPRRASNSKAPTTKSGGATASTHKMYKQVYVVKTTSTTAAASPSAA